MLTYITTYYNNPEFLDTLEETMRYCSDQRLKMIIVDDGSEQPIDDVVAKWNDPRVSLYRITEDLGFNSHGARNLAMKETITEWNILVDIDYRLVNVDNILSQLEAGELESDIPHFLPVAHTFEGKTTPHRESINDFLVTKTAFWKAGGYDPEFTGLHYGDRMFISRMMGLKKGNSLIFGSHLEALRSPFAITQVDESITDPRKERYSDDRKYLYVSAETAAELNHEIVQVTARHRDGGQANSVPFEWERIL